MPQVPMNVKHKKEVRIAKSTVSNTNIKNNKKNTTNKLKKGIDSVVLMEPSSDSNTLYNLVNGLENGGSKAGYDLGAFSAAFDDAFLTESLLGFGELSRDGDSRLNNNHVLNEISMIPGLNNDYSFAGPSWKK